MSSNYAPGSEHDPNAPFNFDKTKWTEWEVSHNGCCCNCEKELPLDEDSLCEGCFEPEEIED